MSGGKKVSVPLCLQSNCQALQSAAASAVNTDTADCMVCVPTGWQDYTKIFLIIRNSGYPGLSEMVTR